MWSGVSGVVSHERHPPRLAFPVLLFLPPTEPLHCRTDAVLLGPSEPRCFDVQSVFGNLADGDLGVCLQVLGDVVFPDISLIAGRLFRGDVPLLEILVGPPPQASQRYLCTASANIWSRSRSESIRC